MHDHPVLIIENAILAGGTFDHLPITAALDGGGVDAVAVDRHGRGAVALDHAEQVLAGIVERPVIGPFEAGCVHVVEGREFLLVQRGDQTFREELLSLPGIVEVDHVPGAGAATA